MTNARSEVEGIAQFSESLFLVLEVSPAQFIETAAGLIILEKLVHLFEQGVVALPEADGPGLLLKRFQNGTGRLLIASPVFVGRDLIVNEGVGLSLNDFENAGVLLDRKSVV